MAMLLPTAGKDAPNMVNVIIEIGANSPPVKYEFDKKAGMLFVDRFLYTSMVYPCNYGFIPQTLSGDGDPVDVLVYSTYPVVPGAVLLSRPVGMLMTEDESGKDAKIIAVPSEKVDPFLKDVQTFKDLPQLFLEQVEHFFKHYKDLEKGKWVKILGWEGKEHALDIIKESVEAFKKNN